MRLVLEVLEFLLERSISGMKTDWRAHIKDIATANFLLGRLRHARENLKDVA